MLPEKCSKNPDPITHFQTRYSIQNRNQNRPRNAIGEPPVLTRILPPLHSPRAFRFLPLSGHSIRPRRHGLSRGPLSSRRSRTRPATSERKPPVRLPYQLNHQPPSTGGAAGADEYDHSAGPHLHRGGGGRGLHRREISAAAEAFQSGHRRFGGNAAGSRRLDSKFIRGMPRRDRRGSGQ